MDIRQVTRIELLSAIQDCFSYTDDDFNGCETNDDILECFTLEQITLLKEYLK